MTLQAAQRSISQGGDVPAEELLAAAQQGDERAFAGLVDLHRAALHALCYRMLGSVHDAEDALQETLVRAWRNLDRFEGRSPLRSWLFTVATNVCLRELERRSRRVLPLDYGPASDPDGELGSRLLESVWVQPYPGAGPGLEAAATDARYEQKESVELAFVAALQHLLPLPRAVLIMRDVLAFSAAEVATALETTPTAVNSALQRARLTIDEKIPARSQQSTLRGLGDARVREIVTDYVDAWERSDVGAVVALLTEDVITTMPPLAEWFEGRESVARFYARRPLNSGLRWRVLATAANAQPAVAHYLWNEPEGSFLAHSICVFSFRGDKITTLSTFLDPELPVLCGLPQRISPAPA